MREGNSMIFFCGAFSVSGISTHGKKNLMDLTSKYKEYFNRSIDIKEFVYEDNSILYHVLTTANNKKYIEYLSKDISVFGYCEIDNKIDIKDKYNLSIKEQSNLEIVAMLYREKGIECLNDIYGNYSIVIIDRQRDNIYLVRDQLGISELYWSLQNGIIYFSNHLIFLDFLYKKNVIQKKYIINYYLNDVIPDFEDTPYPEVWRVKAAEYICFNKTLCISKKVYWDLKWVSSDSTNTDEDSCIAIYKSLFETGLIEKVRSINEGDKLGMLLSGGLDSSTIYAILKKNGYSVETYSAVFNELDECDERKYINKLLEHYSDNKAYFVESDKSGLLVDYPDSNYYTTEPHINMLNKRFSECIYSQCINNNTKIILDGIYADHILGGDIIYLMDQKCNCSVKEKYKQLTEIAKSDNISVWHMIFHVLLREKMDKGYLHGIDKKLIDRYSGYLKNARFDNKDMLIQIKSIQNVKFIDNELAARYGIQCIHPYADRRIIEFLYKISGKFRIKNGIPKYISRKAFENYLPVDISARLSKTQHVALSQKGLRDNWSKIYPRLQQGIFTQIEELGLSKEEWQKLLLAYRSGQVLNDSIFIFLSLEIWLQKISEMYGEIKII